ncbi:unnamed protein product [Moneuplotes crassus]|uniref:Uncharacterized protein n=1 Tax=Euplotes crassus TaxID=5936 RepID=A0AAD1Y1V2_EUPCR|nr:unnamed protein product [Moneuplotes crassus]
MQYNSWAKNILATRRFSTQIRAGASQTFYCKQKAWNMTKSLEVGDLDLTKEKLEHYVKRSVKLSTFKIDEEDIDEFKQDFLKGINFIKKIDEMDLRDFQKGNKKIKPLGSVLEYYGKGGKLREDSSADHDPVQMKNDILNMNSNKMGTLIAVPKIIEK